MISLTVLTAGQFRLCISSIADVSNLLLVAILAARFCNFLGFAVWSLHSTPTRNNSTENGALQYPDTPYLMCFEVENFLAYFKNPCSHTSYAIDATDRPITFHVHRHKSLGSKWEGFLLCINCILVEVLSITLFYYAC